MARQPVMRDYQGVADICRGIRDGGGRGRRWLEREEGEGSDRMEEDTELEEGEALEGGAPAEDWDSYLDTKIEAVLGDCQKEFQGSLYPDKLGSKFGGYGSFLPTHVRGPPVLSDPPQAPASGPPRSRPPEGQMERGRRIPGNGSGAASDRAPNDTGIRIYKPINGVSLSPDGFANVAVKGSKTEDGGLVDQKKGRSITFRINLQGQGVDKVGKKAMYNGFGLDHSSSLSPDEEQDDAVSASEDEVSPDRSPLAMIRIMTSHQLPHGGLLSPLPDLLSEPLDRKEKLKSKKKLAPDSSVIKPEVGMGYVATKVDNYMGKDGKAGKAEKTFEKVKKKPLDRREAIQLLDSAKVSKKDKENDRRSLKERGSNAQKVSYKTPGKDSAREVDLRGEKPDRDVAADVRDVAGREGENPKDFSRSSQKDKVFSLELLKEDGIEQPVTETREVRKVKEDSTLDSKKSRETSLEPNLKDIVAKDSLKEKRKTGGNKDALKIQKEDEARQKDVLKQQTKKEFGKPVPVEAVTAEKELTKDGPWDAKKKGKESNKGSQIQKEVKEKGKDALREPRKEIKKESLKKELVLRDDDNGNEEPKQLSKQTVRDIPRENLKDLGKHGVTHQGLQEVKTGRKAGKKVGREPKLVNKGREREIGLARDFLSPIEDGTGAQLAAPQAALLPLATGPGAEAPAGAILPAGQLVLDHWVQCDKCQQWRLLIPGIDPDDLPEKWLCKMMTWLPDLNHCKFVEDVTTQAVYNYLGLQNPALPQANPALQGQQPLLVPSLAPPSDAMLDNKKLEAKPAKVQRSSSKKGMGKKPGGGTGKLPIPRTEMGSVKSKSLNDVVQHPMDRVTDRSDLETVAAEDVGKIRGMPGSRKLKEKEKLKRMRPSEGDDARPQKQAVREEERNRALGSWQDHEWGQLGKASVKVPVALDSGNVGEGNVWNDSLDPEPGKRQKVKLLQDGGKSDTAGLKRKKKNESSEENDDLRSLKKSKGEETRYRRTDATARHRGYDDGGSLQYGSDEGAVQEGEYGDFAGISSKNVARGTNSGQPFKKVKVTPATTRDTMDDSKREDLPDERKMKDHQKLFDVKCKDSFEKQESSGSDKDKYRREDPGRRMIDNQVSRQAESKGRDTQADAKKRMKGGETESRHHIEKRRMVHEVQGLGASRELLHEQKKGQLKRSDVSSETEFHLDNHSLERPRVPLLLKDEKDDHMRVKSGRPFEDNSGIARTYKQQPFQTKADETSNGESPLPYVGQYTMEAGKQAQKGGLHPHSSTSSASKVPYSAESSAFGSKGGSPIESTVSSSPLRSSKVDAAVIEERVSEGVQNNHTTHYSHPPDKLNSISPSPKRSVDQDVDAHRSWVDRPHSSDPEREFRVSGQDPTTDTSSGRARDDRYATSNSREGADFRKYDRSRNGRDDDRYWEEARETRPGSGSYRHRDVHYREREDSVDRYRDRDSRYERRGSREDRFRERDRERDRSRENWPTDRGGDGREDRYSRERSERQDRGGRPSSRESRLDKQGSLNWRDEPRLARDPGREARDRAEDENAENKHEIGSNHVEGSKDGHPDEDELEAAQDLQKDDSGHRYEKITLGAPKEAKSNFGRAPPPGLASNGREGDRIGVASSGRKDSDASALRNGLEAQTKPTHVNSRSRVEGSQSGLGSMGARGKPGQGEGAALDRIVEGGRQGKEHKSGANEDAVMRVSALKALGSSGHITRCGEKESLSLSKKEHVARSQALTKEGKDLKHSADRLKNSMEGESTTNLYLQAALKFLQSAHHLEMSSSETMRQGDTQSMLMYNDTARLCDFCAATYERQRDLAAAALAHICAAVARFRAMMAKSASLNKDCIELQNAANPASAPGSVVATGLTPPQGQPSQQLFSHASEKPGSSHGVRAPSVVGESPSSSSASDVDNLNNHTVAGDKGLAATAVKGSAPSPVVGSTSGSTDLIPQRLHSNFQRVIRNGKDVFDMMESWTKAQNATAAAESAYAGGALRVEGMAAVRRVGEIGLLGNMDAVVQQVRVALEAIGH